MKHSQKYKNEFKMKKRIIFLTGIMLGSIFFYAAFLNGEKEIVDLTENGENFIQDPELGSVGLNYTGTSYSVGAQDIFPEGFFWDGTYWWMIGSNSDQIHKYYSDWTYTGISHDISGQFTTPTDIFWDGTNWWGLGDGTADRVYKYDSDWSYTGISHYVGGQEPAPKGIFWDGMNWWLVGLHNRVVYKYNSDWSYAGESHYLGGQMDYPSDLYWDGVNWWVPGVYNNRVYIYNSDWSYTGNSYDLGGLDTNPEDFFSDGNYWYMLGYENSRVYKYEYDDIQSPVIDFEISDKYLNSTRPLETDLGLQINCSISDNSAIEGTYLSENSTGVFINRSMVLGVNGSWSYNVDISSLVEDDLLMFSFFANDSYNNIGVLDNAGLNFSILIGDYFRDPIYINDDDDFTVQNGVRDPWVSGTEEDPYIIEDWIIDAGASGSAIFIENTTKSFKIENCILNNSGINIDDAGIRFYNVSNGKIINNKVSNNGWTGIRLLKSINNTIIYNIANNNSDMGIYLRDGSNNNSVTNNICNNNSQWGIELNINSDGNLITGNIVNYNDKVGIQINSGCDLNLIYSNIIVGNIQNNANDDGFSNNWDNGTIGNYWGDYESNYPNAWNDGFFWDTAYLIPGSTTSYDYHPTDNFLEEDPQYFNFTTSLMTYSSGGLYEFNCTWTDDDNAVSEVFLKFNGTFYLVNKNFTGEFSYTFKDLPANENGYEYQWLAKDQFNAWNITPINYFIVSKVNVSLSLKFNSTEGDYVSKMNNYVNISLSNLNNTIGELQIFIDNLLIGSGTNLLISNLSYYQIPGIYNITGMLKHQNYTGQITYWMTINEIYPPNIIFQISTLHLNTTTPQYNQRLQIICNVNDDSPISWVYLCENSTGTFLNRSMSFINSNYTITLDLQLLNWSDAVMFSFYANDSLGNFGWENNGGLNYSIQIYDFDSPMTSILFELYFDPYYVNKSIYFSLAAEDQIEFGSAGVNITYYKIDNGPWESYNSPFNLSSYLDGFHNISYYSSDIAGNIENLNILEIYMITEESDIDGDGLNHYDEINIYLTDPFDSDSDDDGLTDEEEVITYLTNPILDDSDGDRLTDGEEVHNYNTNPLSRDTDGDGYSDYDEIFAYQTEPNNAFSSLTMTLIISLIIFSVISISSYIGVKKGKTIHRRRIEKKVITHILGDKIKVLDCNALNNKLQKVKSSMNFEDAIKEKDVNGQYIQNRSLFVKNLGIEKFSSLIEMLIKETYIQNLSKQEESSLIKIDSVDLEKNEWLLEFIKDLKLERF